MTIKLHKNVEISEENMNFCMVLLNKLLKNKSQELEMVKKKVKTC